MDRTARRPLRRLLAALTAAVLLVGCQAGTPAPDPTDRPPVLTITSPAANAVLPFAAPIALRATAVDPDEGDVSERVSWTGDRAGPLGLGAALDVALAAGQHVITARVVDATGLAASAEVRLTVLAEGPPTEELRIVPSPLVLAVGASIDLGLAPDPATPTDVAWSTEAAGIAVVDAGGRLTATGEGVTIVTARVAGEPERSATAEVTVLRPDLTIVAPTATPAVLPVGGAATVSWSWTPDIDLAHCTVRAPAAQPDVVHLEPCAAEDATVALRFDAPGLHAVTIELRRGEDPAVTSTLTVNAGLPHFAQASVDRRSIDRGDPVTFVAAAIDPDGTAVTCTLLPGDGSPAQALGGCSSGAVTVTHTYATAGRFQAVIVAVDAEGHERSAGLTVDVIATPLRVEILSDGWGGLLGDPLSFTARSSGGQRPADVTRWTLTRTDGVTVDDSQGPGLPRTYLADVAVAGSYRLAVVVDDGVTSAAASRTFTVAESALGAPVDLVIFGFAGRCGGDCDPDTNAAYLDDPGRTTLASLAQGFLDAGAATSVRTYSLRAHLLDHPLRGRGFQSAALLAEAMHAAWNAGPTPATRFVAVGYSHGGAFASLLPFALPGVPFAYVISIDAVCGAFGTTFDGDHIASGWFDEAYGGVAAYPPPLNAVPSACGGHAVPGFPTRGIDQIAPFNAATSLEVHSGGEIGLPNLRDRTVNVRPDGSSVGILARAFPDELHRGIERSGSAAMAWLRATIADLEGP